MSEVLIINSQEVRELASMSECIDAVEKAFGDFAEGGVEMPVRQIVDVEKHNGTLLYLPAYIKRLGAVGQKVVSIYPNNPEKYNLSTVMAIIQLNDPKTGAPIALMDGTFVTQLRTGAISGIATKYLSKKDACKVGIIGAGTQGRGQLRGINEVRDIGEVKVFDVSVENKENYVREMSKEIGVEIRGVDSVKEAVKGADIVSTTTPSTKPIIIDKWVGQGTHINAIGADTPGKEEIDPEILKRAKVVTDYTDQSIKQGDINVPFDEGMISRDDIYSELGEIVIGKRKGRESAEEITIFDTSGIAIEDISTAHLIYGKAKEKDVGKRIEI